MTVLYRRRGRLHESACHPVDPVHVLDELESQRTVEADRACILTVHAKVNSHGTGVDQSAAEFVDQQASPPVTAAFWKQVDVQVCGEHRHDVVGRPRGVVQLRDDRRVGLASYGIARIAGAEGWPPLSLGARAEGERVDGAPRVSGRTAEIEGEARVGLESEIRADIHLADEPRIVEQIGGVFAGVAAAQTNLVERVPVLVRCGADHEQSLTPRTVVSGGVGP